MILAECASEIAARRPKAQHRRPWQEMVEWLLFDGVDTKAARSSVSGEDNFITLPPPHKT